MVKKQLPDLNRLPDDHVIEFLRGCAQLSFSQSSRCKQRIDRMQGLQYEEACRLLNQLSVTGEEHPTGQQF